MVEAHSPTNRHIVKKDNLPAINENVTLDKEAFNREETLTAIKVPVL